MLTSSPCFSRFNESWAVILNSICISTLRPVSSSELGLIDWSRNARQLLQKVDVQSCFVWRSLFDLLIPFDARFESRISYCRSWAFEFWVRGYNFIGNWSTGIRGWIRADLKCTQLYSYAPLRIRPLSNEIIAAYSEFEGPGSTIRNSRLESRIERNQQIKERLSYKLVTMQIEFKMTAWDSLNLEKHGLEVRMFGRLR
jgi:hypothetical protein